MIGRASWGASEHLDFELPFTSKLLLLAAYICSRNKPTLDRRLFDPSSRAGRRRNTMASDKQVSVHLMLARLGRPCPDVFMDAACPLTPSTRQAARGSLHL